MSRCFWCDVLLVMGVESMVELIAPSKAPRYHHPPYRLHEGITVGELGSKNGYRGVHSWEKGLHTNFNFLLQGLIEKSGSKVSAYVESHINVPEQPKQHL